MSVKNTIFLWILVSTPLDGLEQKSAWAGLSRITMIEETRQFKGRIRTDRRFFISRLPPMPSKYPWLYAPTGPLKIHGTGHGISCSTKINQPCIKTMRHRTWLSCAMLCSTY